MILQGDHRENAAKMLKENGFSEGAIEIIFWVQHKFPKRGAHDRQQEIWA
jgi:hypothetical protein